MMQKIKIIFLQDHIQTYFKESINLVNTSGISDDFLVGVGL